MTTSEIIIDTHAHLYPIYDYESAIRSAYENLSSLAFDKRTPTLCVILTERSDCNAFEELSKLSSIGNFKIHTTSEESSLRIEIATNKNLWVLAGSQIATMERLEVLSLLSRERVSDGLPIGDTLRKVNQLGGIPVIPWSPGKWMFGRGALIRRLIVDHRHDLQFLLADTAIRPFGFPTPGLLRLAKREGIPVLAGTDPLPLAGEEERLGRYGSRFEGEFDQTFPSRSIRKILFGDHTSVGKRLSVLGMMSRIRKLKFSQSKGHL